MLATPDFADIAHRGTHPLTIRTLWALIAEACALGPLLLHHNSGAAAATRYGRPQDATLCLDRQNAVLDAIAVFVPMACEMNSQIDAGRSDEAAPADVQELFLALLPDLRATVEQHLSMIAAETDIGVP